ncbi:MAG: hypothetical protein AB1782_20160 [Cyanobacteriota bacterium]
MTDRYDIIPASNPIEKDKKAPTAFVAFNKKAAKKLDPSNDAVSVVMMHEVGETRITRRREVLNYFPDNSPEGAKTVEKIVDKTTGFSHKQLSSLLSHIRLRDFRDEEKFMNYLNEGIQKTWLEDL